MRQRVRGEVAAIAVAEQADARAVHIRLLLEPGEAVLDVAELELAEISEERPHRHRAFAAGCSVVARPDKHAAPGEELLVHVIQPTPAVRHLLKMRPSIDMLN